MSGWDLISASLDEVRAGCEESGRFFAELFDCTERLLDELLQEQERWRDYRERAEKQLRETTAKLDQRERQIDAERAELERSRATGQVVVDQASQEGLQKIQRILESIQSDYAALKRSPTDANHQGQEKGVADLAGQLNEARLELSNIRAKIEQLAGPLETVANETISEQTREWLQVEAKHLREDRDAMRQERLAMGAELDQVRRRAAEMVEAFEEQKRLAAERELQWRDELAKQDNRLVELTKRLTQAISAGEKAKKTILVATNAGRSPEPVEDAADAAWAADLALETVREQFELLQKEAAERRRENDPPAADKR